MNRYGRLEGYRTWLGYLPTAQRLHPLVVPCNAATNRIMTSHTFSRRQHFSTQQPGIRSASRLFQSRRLESAASLTNDRDARSFQSSSVHLRNTKQKGEVSEEESASSSSRVANPTTCASTKRRRTSSSAFPEEEWDTVIGLEVHAQLKTRTKLFSPSNARFSDPPNTNVVPFDMAAPGTLPVVNRPAVQLTLVTALALGCTINLRSTFDRKHYFYHDIPASYQITQHYNPIATDGEVLFTTKDAGVERDFGVRIQQIQIEQDTAKTSRLVAGSSHTETESANEKSEVDIDEDGDNLFIDLNRAGVGLMEIVSEADLRSPGEAGAYIRKLQGILRRLGASDGDMEKGSLRVDANVSIRRKGEKEFGTRCEIKNLNSVRFMQQALESERRRHLAFYLENPDSPIPQETRGFDESSGQTYSLRSKEDAEDYRYMPDPNLPPLVIDLEYLDHLRSELPELPSQLRDRLSDEYKISQTDADTLINLDERSLAGIDYFERVMKVLGHQNGKKVANWMLHEIMGRLTAVNETWNPDRVPVDVLAELVKLVDDKQLTGTAAKNLLKHLLEPSSTAKETQPVAPTASHLLPLAESLGLTSSTRMSVSIEALCESAIAASPKEVESFRRGNEKVVMRIVGWVMKESRGTADAKKAAEIITNLLRQP